MLAAGTALGPYTILAPLGAGGMGEVYRARDPRLAREVAVKVVRGDFARDPERIRRFEQEARAAGALNHPNVVTIFDAGVHEGAPFVVMELLEGESLREKLGAGALPLRKALAYAAQAAHGLAAAHAKGIVHRDLKPENLFVTKDGRVKVLDFGLAKLTRPELPADAGDPMVSVAATESGVLLGTAGYMAPEQLRGRAVDARADLFALGAVVHEMVSGRRAFKGESFIETSHAILSDEPAPLSTLRPDAPPALEALVRHCLEKDPAQRFQSARDLAFALEAIVPSDRKAPDRPVAGRRRAAVAAVVVIALFGVALGWMLRSRAVPPASLPTFQRLTFQRGTIFGARFVAADRSVLYDASWNGQPAQVYSAIAGTPESRALTAGGARLLGLSSTGDMALQLDPHALNPVQATGTLARAPFAGGAPREILEDVLCAEWSPDGTALAVVRRVEGRDRLEFPVGTVLYQTAGWISEPRFSRRGDRIAFLEHPLVGDEAGSVAMVDRAGKKTTLTGPWGETRGLAWSAHDDEVWFTAEQGAAARALYAVSPSGRQRMVLRQAGPLKLHDIAPDGRVLLSRDDTRIGLVGFDRAAGKERDLSWLDWSLGAALSADGRTVLFTEMSTGVGAKYAVCLRGTDGSPAVRLGEGWAEGLSADGKWAIAITRGQLPGLAVLPTGAGTPRTLPRGRIESFLWASLFPDGRRVLVAGQEKGGPPRLYVQDLAGGEPRALDLDEIGAGYYWNPISPDGQRAAFPDLAGGFRIRPLFAESAPSQRALEPGESPVAWSPDGQGLYVFTESGTRAEIRRVDLAGGKRTLVRVLEPEDPAGLMTFGPVLVTPDGQTYAYNYFRILSDLYVVEGLK